ncbi:MAG: non-ribosomal peptide synthetase, partial [Alteromonadaceae bacterium]
KGVMIERKGFRNLIHWYGKEYAFSAEDKTLIVSSIGFDLTQKNLFTPLINGGQVVLLCAEGYDPDTVVKTIGQHGVSMINCAPSMLYGAVESAASDDYQSLSSLRHALIGGEPINAALLNPWLNHSSCQAALVNMYGPTECSDIVSASLQGRTIQGDCIGQVIANTSVYVLRPNNELSHMGAVGELCVAGVGLARGYLNRPELSAEKFISNPFYDPASASSYERLYKTGDLVRWLPDTQDSSGNLEFMGRIDYQVKIRGFRIELGEIENTLRMHEAIKDALVLVKTAANTAANTDDKQLVAYVVTDTIAETIAENSTNFIDALREHLSQSLPDYMLPAAFVLLERMPLTPNGKVDRKALPEPDLSALQASYVAPRNDIETRLCVLWQDVLSVDRVGIHDNFFHLGGHSLLATRLIARINQALNVSLPLKSLFDHPSLERLAQVLLQLDHDLDRPALVPVSREQVLPASFAQQRLWLLSQIDDGSAHYNMPSVLKLSGELNTNALNQTFNRIIERHESLRTCFAAGNDGQAVQVIQTPAGLAVPIISLFDLDLNLDADTRKLQIKDLIDQEASRSFDLSSDLMLRAQLLSVSANEHLLLVTMHHIASDGWSMSILINEFSTLYNAYAQGLTDPLAPLSIQYADYAHWQRRCLQGEVLAQHLAYWKKQLAGVPVVHSLPLDHPRPALQSFVGKTFVSKVEGATNRALKSLCEAQGATLFMGLQATLAVLLARYSNENDIVIGSPIANREQVEVADLIGFFVNNLVLRSDLSGNPSFIELLQQSKGMLLDAYAHQQVSFEQVVEVLQPERHLSHNVLFQVMLVLQNNEEGILELPGLTLQPENHDVGIAKYDLTLNVMDSTRGLDIAWEYNTDLFEQGTIARMAEHFSLLLQSLLGAPQQSVFKAEMLSAVECTQLLVEWNGRRAEYSSELCVHQLFEARVTQNPDAIALSFEGQQLSYAQLNSRANQLAHFLINDRSPGQPSIRPDTLVGLCFERSMDMIVGILAVLKAGGAYVPLDPEYPDARFKYILDDAKINIVLTHSDIRAPLSDVQAVCLDDARLQQQLQQLSIENPDAKILGLNASHLAYVIYTSGSTGNPKGVMVEHCNVTRLFDSAREAFVFNHDDVWTMFHSYAFDFSVWEIWGALTQGGRLVVVPYWISRSPSDFYQLLRQEKVTVLNQTPSAFTTLIQEDAKQQASLALRYVVFGGEALNLASLSPWFERNSDQQSKLVNMYGITETTVHVTYREITRDVVEAAAGSCLIGRPLADLQLLILNQDQALVPVGVTGEMYVGGAGVARGYLNQAELTASRFLTFSDMGLSHLGLPEMQDQRFYRTGDLARHLPNGELDYQGRIDHQVKIRGFRIELGEIENTLNTHADVLDTIVLAKSAVLSDPSENNSIKADQGLVAYVVTNAVDLNENATTAQHVFIESLRTHLEQSLPDYMRPSAFVLLAQFPLTPNGKIDRKALPEPDVATQQTDYVGPRNETETTLCGIWQEVLGLERVGIQDNFFQLGGHSLSVLQLISSMNAALNANINVRDVFVAPTIEGLITEADFSQSSVVLQQLEVGLKEIEALQQAILADPLQQQFLPQGYDDFFPLSAIQQSMVFFAQTQADEPLYHDQFPYLVSLSNFDLTRFQTAVDHLGQSHGILRSGFDAINFDVPLQVVHRQSQVQVQLDDVSHLPEALQQQEIEALQQAILADPLQQQFLPQGYDD